MFYLKIFLEMKYVIIRLYQNVSLEFLRIDRLTCKAL